MQPGKTFGHEVEPARKPAGSPSQPVEDSPPPEAKKSHKEDDVSIDIAAVIAAVL